MFSLQVRALLDFSGSLRAAFRIVSSCEAGSETAFLPRDPTITSLDLYLEAWSPPLDWCMT